jgi:predicted nuclease of predicted toxin-antitoxin system
MLRLLADENFNHAIVRGMLRRLPALDVVTIQELILSGAPDPQVLEAAAHSERLLMTHDVNTIPAHVRRRIESGLRVPGIIEISATAAPGEVIDDLLILVQCSFDGEWENQIVRVPL